MVVGEYFSLVWNFSLFNNILFIRFLLECFYTKPIIMLCFSCVCFNSSLFLDRSFSSIPSPKLQNKSYFRILCTTRSSHDCSSYCWLIRPFWSKTRLKMLRCAMLVCLLLGLFARSPLSIFQPNSCSKASKASMAAMASTDSPKNPPTDTPTDPSCHPPMAAAAAAAA